MDFERCIGIWDIDFNDVLDNLGIIFKGEVKMSWQVCPICKGTGSVGYQGILCDVCKGKKIINEVNGRPPEKVGIKWQ